MALNFPNSPVNGQTYLGDNGVTYTYDGVKWKGTSIAYGGTFPTATSSQPGLVQPDGTTITIVNGVISSSGGGSTNKLVNGGNEIILEADGTLASPGGSWTKTTNNSLSTGVASQVVWTSTVSFISGAKLTIQVEVEETGGIGNWETQVCEAVIAVRGYDTNSQPVISVYGITHTSVAPLMTFTVDRNSTTNLIEIVGTRTGTARLNDGASLRIYSVETGTND